MGDLPDDECTVSDALYYVLRTSQVHGVASLSFRKDGKVWHIHVPNTSWLIGRISISMIALIMLVISFVDSYVDFGTLIPLPLTIHHVVDFASLITVMAVLAVEAYTASNRMQNIIICLSQIQKINTELLKYGPRKSFSKTERFLAIWSPITGHTVVITSCILYSNTLISTSETYVLKVIYNGLWYLMIVILKILILQISMILLHVLSSFNHLNDCLEIVKQHVANKSINFRSELNRQVNVHHRIPSTPLNTVTDTSGNNQDIINQDSNKTSETVQILSYLYFCLQGVVQLLDECHGMVLMMFMFYSCLYILATPYYYMVSSAEHDTIALAIIQIMWIIYPISDLMMIIEPCHRTHKQMSRTKQLVSHLLRLCSREDSALKTELELFCKSLIREETAYCPMMIFRMDRPVLVTVLANVITYLVVITQL